ncbi:MAG: cysteine hydrolase [Actinomycetota bacterium]|nr:MAG: cysteine hydrolase [Actinomycetota bacterium]
MADAPVSGVAGTTPYPWPFDGRLDPRRLVLVLVSPMEAGSAAPQSESTAAAVRIAAAVTAVGGKVVHVATIPPGRPRASVQWAGAAAGGSADGPLAAAADVTMVAAGIDGFFGTSLDHALRSWGVDQVLIGGIGLETSVHSTMRSANDRGFECLLVVDACAAADPSLTPAAVSMIEMSGGIFGAVGTTPAVLAALQSC